MLRREVKTVWKALRAFPRHDPLELAAALSYYTLLSLAPIVLVTVSVAGLAFGREAVEGHIVLEMRGLMGDAAAELVQMILRNAAEPARSTVSLVVGLVTLLVGATTVFMELQSAMNDIWGVEAKKERAGLWRILRKRLLSLGMVLAIGFLLLVSLVLSAGLSAVSAWAARSSGLGGAFPLLLRAADIVASVLVVTVLLALMFKYLPDAEIGWRDVASGALVTAVLFTVGKVLIGVYLGRASVGSAYGAAGSVVVFLVWVYYAAIILLFGAKLTQVRTERESGRPQPEPHAVSVGPEKGLRVS